MSATVIQLRPVETGGEQSPLCPSHRATVTASLTDAARRYWRRVRGTVEAFGWLCVAASVFAAIRG